MYSLFRFHSSLQMPNGSIDTSLRHELHRMSLEMTPMDSLIDENVQTGLWLLRMEEGCASPFQLCHKPLVLPMPAVTACMFKEFLIWHPSIIADFGQLINDVTEAQVDHAESCCWCA